jgi:hypothetical protein
MFVFLYMYIYIYIYIYRYRYAAISLQPFPCHFLAFSEMPGKQQGKVKNLAMKRDEMKELKWAKWWAERKPAIEQDKQSGTIGRVSKPLVQSEQAKKVIAMKAEESRMSEKQQLIKKTKNLKVESEVTGNELEGKGNEDDDDEHASEDLGEEHASDMTSDEDMQVEIEKHIEAEGEGTENKQEGESPRQRCSACGWKRPDQGIVECKACGAVN